MTGTVTRTQRTSGWALALLFVASVPSFASAASLRKGPYLIYRNDPAAMTVLWQLDGAPGQILLEWGAEEDLGRSAKPSAGDALPGGEHRFAYTIGGLKPATRYAYRLTVDGQASAGDFRTAPAADATSVTLYAYGDSRTHLDDHDRVCASMLADIDAEPDARQTLVLQTGDWVGTGDDENEWDRFFDAKYAASRRLLARMPLMGARGNHEDDGVLLRKYWPYAYADGTACRYAFDYGPVHVAVVDQYEPFSRGTAQYDWLRADLATTAKPWKVVVFHEPAYGAGTHPNDEMTQRELCPLFERTGVDLVLCGHNHNYARCAVNGIRYVTTGGAGAPSYKAEPPEGEDRFPYVQASESTLHFVRLAVDGRRMTVTAVRPDGSEVESFAFEQGEPTPSTPPTPFRILAWAGLPAPLFLVLLLAQMLRQRRVPVPESARAGRSSDRSLYFQALAALLLLLYLIYMSPRIHHRP